MIKKKTVLIFVASFFVLGQSIFAQDKVETADKPKAKLIQSGSYQTSELASLHIDLLRNETQRNSSGKGVIIVFCGKNCQYGEVEAHLRGIDISLRGKGVEIKDFVILHGGFKEKLTIEYWFVPEAACLPIPESTIDIKNVKFTGTYRGKFVPYDCCEY